jgi:hypothetical protein
MVPSNSIRVITSEAAPQTHCSRRREESLISPPEPVTPFENLIYLLHVSRFKDSSQAKERSPRPRPRPRPRSRARARARSGGRPRSFIRVNLTTPGGVISIKQYMQLKLAFLPEGQRGGTEFLGRQVRGRSARPRVANTCPAHSPPLATHSPSGAPARAPHGLLLR